MKAPPRRLHHLVPTRPTTRPTRAARAAVHPVMYSALCICNGVGADIPPSAPPPPPPPPLESCCSQACGRAWRAEAHGRSRSHCCCRPNPNPNPTTRTRKTHWQYGCCVVVGGVSSSALLRRCWGCRRVSWSPFFRSGLWDVRWLWLWCSRRHSVATYLNYNQKKLIADRWL